MNILIRKFFQLSKVILFAKQIKAFVETPNVSPGFDANWETNGLADKAVNLLAKWVEGQKLKGCTVKVLKEPKRTHMILVEVQATEKKADEKSILFYGHCDKQPPCTEQWRAGLHPYKPVIENGRLYGRGASDDGYSLFAIIGCIKACQELGIPHDRCVVTIESCEESGSSDLGYYMNKVKDVIKIPSLMVIMDSGCGDYERLWVTSSLRGNLKCDFKVQILKESVHSGDAGGIVPETFRIIRQILDRIDDPKTGRVVDTFQVKIPEKRENQIKEAAKLLGKKVYDHFQFAGSAGPMAIAKTEEEKNFELLLNRTWKANMAITGADGLPKIQDAGNVLRSETSIRASLRIPPTLDPEKAKKDLMEIITKDPPYGAKVEVIACNAGSGLNAPELTPELEKTVTEASKHFYGHEPIYYGEGGSIPFLSELHAQFPKAQFFITGVLGPESNAHGPNEMLELNFTKKMICVLSYVVGEFHKQKA